MDKIIIDLSNVLVGLSFFCTLIVISAILRGDTGCDCYCSKSCMWEWDTYASHFCGCMNACPDVMKERFNPALCELKEDCLLGRGSFTIGYVVNPEPVLCSDVLKRFCGGGLK